MSSFSQPSPTDQVQSMDPTEAQPQKDNGGHEPSVDEKTGLREYDRNSGGESFWIRPEPITVAISGLLYVSGLVWELLVPETYNFLLFTLGGIEIQSAEVVLLGALVVAGYHTIRRGVGAVLDFTMSIDFLMTFALMGALILGKFLEAASLAFLYGVAELLEDYSMLQARNSLEQLLDLSPEAATVLRDGNRVTVEVENIDVGTTIAVRPGEKIAMDGEVIDGKSSVNQAPVTGESMPVDKQPGDEVYAGTFNEEGYLEIEVTRRVEDNTLARIIELVKEAEATKAPSQRFVDRFAGYYTPTIVGLALFVGLVVPFLPGIAGEFSTWWLRAMALLVIACPCGLLISTPVTVVSGITSAARHGTLIKGGEAFEGLGQLDAICFDKTGTLSEGEPAVSDVVSTSELSKEEILAVAASVESRSEHHLAEAILGEAEDRGIAIPEVSEFEAVTAAGVSGRVDGSRYYVGKPELLGEDHPGAYHNLEQDGKTVVSVGTVDELLGVIALSDPVRAEARQVISDLHEAGMEVIMITGDNERTARSVAEELSIDRYHAELLPEDKVEEVERLKKEYGSVAMVGDGINDAPALARADVGIAMGAAGSDTAIETADVALMGDNLNHGVYAVRLSRQGESIIKQNITSSIGVKLLLALGVIPGFVNLITAVLVGDMGISLGVTGNAMRLRRLDFDN